jgi:hypothetical protein
MILFIVFELYGKDLMTCPLFLCIALPSVIVPHVIH